MRDGVNFGSRLEGVLFRPLCVRTMRGTDGADISSEDRYARWQMNEDMPSRRNQKTIELLKDTEVKRWYERKIPRSYESARVRLSNLANFCEATGLMPDQIARMEEPELARVVEDFVDVERERGMKGPTIAKRVDSIRAWRQYSRRIFHFRLAL